MTPTEDGWEDCLPMYAAAATGLHDPRDLDRALLRAGNARALDILAWRVSGGLWTNEGFERRVAGKPSEALLGALFDEPPDSATELLRFARVVALRASDPAQRARALTLIEAVELHYGASAFSPDSARLYAVLAFAASRFELAERVVRTLRLRGSDRRFLAADLSNPFGPSSTADPSAWPDAFAAVFQGEGWQSGLMPALGTHGQQGEPFDRLVCRAAEIVEDGPLVTVMVTSFKPDQGLLTAVGSILAQSWRRLEVLVIDDASPAGHEAVLREAADLDPRVRVVQCPINGGTYRARNLGLGLAKGEFVTGQDSDDWSHPLRIERQVEAMLENPALVCTTSHAVRCDGNLVFNSPGMTPMRENASSLMFRRKPVLDRVGFYDSSRKGADTEYLLRMKRGFGERAHALLPDIMAVIRFTQGSLSGGDFRPGWRHPSRAAYRRAYQYWHDSVAGLRQLRMPADAGGDGRRFPSPARFVDTAQGREETVDVLLLDDLRSRSGDGEAQSVVDEVLGLLDAGLRVGVMHLRSFRDASATAMDGFHPELQRAIHERRVREVISTEEIHVGTLVVRRPELALFLPDWGVLAHPERVLVRAVEPLPHPGGTWYPPATCDELLRAAFSATPRWSPAAGSRQALVHALPPQALIEADWPSIVYESRWRAPRRGHIGDRAVLGVHVDDPASEGVEGALFWAQIAAGNAFATVLLYGDAVRIRQVLGRKHLREPLQLRVSDAHTTPPMSFLAACDALACYAPPGTEYPHHRILRAIASGCLVFGDGASLGDRGAVVRVQNPTLCLETLDGLREAQRHDEMAEQARDHHAGAFGVAPLLRLLADAGQPVPGLG